MSEDLRLFLDVLHDTHFELYCDIRHAMYSTIDDEDSRLTDEEKETIDHILDEYTHSSHAKY